MQRRETGLGKVRAIRGITVYTLAVDACLGSDCFPRFFFRFVLFRALCKGAVCSVDCRQVKKKRLNDYTRVESRW